MLGNKYVALGMIRIIFQWLLSIFCNPVGKCMTLSIFFSIVVTLLMVSNYYKSKECFPLFDYEYLDSSIPINTTLLLSGLYFVL